MKGNLFPRLAFSPDETHASWAGRLAAFHTGGGVEEFLNDLRIPLMAFFRGHPEFVKKLCAIADQDPEPVLKNTILRARSTKYVLNKEEFGSGLLVGKLTRFCPMCLLEDDRKGARPNSQRREHLAWRFRTVFVCPIHHIYLMSDGCQSGQTSSLADRVPLGTEDLEVLANGSQAATPSPVQTYLLDRISGAKGPEWLDGQNLDQATNATEILGAVIEFGHRVSTDQMTVENWHRAGCVGWDWTSKGEDGLRQAFRILQATGPRAMDARDRSPGYKFGTLYHWLALKFNHDDRGPIRDLLRQYIVETEAITTSRKVLGVTVSRNHIKPRKVEENSKPLVLSG